MSCAGEGNAAEGGSANEGRKRGKDDAGERGTAGKAKKKHWE